MARVERDLDDVKQVRLERKVAHDHLGGVTEGRVEQAAQRLVGVQRHLLGGLAQQTRQRQDGQAGDAEDGGVGPLEVLGEEGERHEDEQQVQLVAEEHVLGAVEE